MSTPASADSGEVFLPALITRTSSELLGKRPLPRVLRERPILFVLGPRGVGKTTVSRHILSSIPGVREASFRSAVVSAARDRTWAPELREAPGLLFDDVDFLYNRFGAQALLGGLLRDRALAGHKTILVQGVPDASVTLLYDTVPLLLRASLLLRFPVGRGRRQHVNARCADRGIAFNQARSAVTMEPWSYALVEQSLDGITGS